MDKKYNNEKKEVMESAEKEAEQIFMKTQPWSDYKKWDQKWKTWSYPKLKESNYWTKYWKRAKEVSEQVVKTRLKQFKNKDSK